MADCVYRDFSREQPYTVGSIKVYLISCNRVQVIVEGLHENYPLDYPAGQAELMMTLDPEIPVYDAILAVLDQLTNDHDHVLRDTPYLDFVLCDADFAREHPSICRDDQQPDVAPSNHTHWMPFTRENTTYLISDEDDDPTEEDDSSGIILCGQVVWDADRRPQCRYDFPVISRDMDPVYYQLTRGQRTCDASLGHMYEDALPMDAGEFLACKSKPPCTNPRNV